MKLTVTGLFVLLATFQCVHAQNLAGIDNLHTGNLSSSDLSVSENQPTAEVTFVQFDPFVIRAGLDNTKLKITIEGDDVVEVRWNNQGNYSRGGSAPDFLTLLDDGSQGDDVANDNIFTIDELTPVNFFFELFGPAYFHGSGGREVIFVFADGHQESEMLNFNQPKLGHIDPSVVPIPSVQRSVLAPEFDHTEFVISIQSTSDDRRVLANEYYSVLEDDRDFLLLASLPSTEISSSGFLVRVKNEISGIGLSMFDHSAHYGSNGILQGVVGLLPSAPFVLLNHEILHRWAVYLDASLDLGASHWGVIERPSTGFGASAHGAYPTIEHISGNMYRAAMGSEPYYYNDLELYLMGLLELTEVVSPIRTLVNPVRTGTENINGEVFAIFEADGLRDVSTGEIQSIHGIRTPTPLDSQKSFKAGMLVVHDRPLTEVEFAYYDYVMREYEKTTSDSGLTFEEATGSRATISTRLFPLTRYVATTGSDADNDCTNQVTPCATIAHAVSLANDGETLDIAPGTYNESGLIFDKKLNIRGEEVVMQ